MSRSTVCIPTAILLVGLGGCSDEWPPAVTTAQEIAELKPEQAEIRCIRCGDEEMRAVAEHLKLLDYLFVNNTSELTDDGIVALTELTGLRQLVVLDASSLSDASLNVIADMSQIRELALHEGTEFSPDGLLALARNPSLQRVYLCNTPRITDAAIARLRLQLPDSDILVDATSCPGYFPQ